MRRARRPVVLLASMVVAAAFPSASRAADPITGTWQQVDEDGEVGALVALAVDHGAVVGRITKVFPGPGEPEDPVCEKCPGALRGKPVVGLAIVRGLKPEGRHYAGGRILDPETGDDYDLQADLSPDGQSLSVRAYRGLSLLGRSQTWRRAP